MTDENATQEPAAPPRMVTVAQLDASRVFHGVLEIPEHEVTDAHLVLPNGCDLAPGAYRHDPEKGAFVPIEPAAEGMQQQDPQAMRAIALGYIALLDQGLTLPPETLVWLDWYSSSMDFLGPLDDASAAMVKRYRARKGG